MPQRRGIARCLRHQLMGDVKTLTLAKSRFQPDPDFAGKQGPRRFQHGVQSFMAAHETGFGPCHDPCTRQLLCQRTAARAFKGQKGQIDPCSQSLGPFESDMGLAHIRAIDIWRDQQNFHVRAPLGLGHALPKCTMTRRKCPARSLAAAPPVNASTDHATLRERLNKARRLSMRPPPVPRNACGAAAPCPRST